MWAPVYGLYSSGMVVESKRWCGRPLPPNHKSVVVPAAG